MCGKDCKGNPSDRLWPWTPLSLFIPSLTGVRKERARLQEQGRQTGFQVTARWPVLPPPRPCPSARHRSSSYLCAISGPTFSTCFMKSFKDTKTLKELYSENTPIRHPGFTVVTFCPVIPETAEFSIVPGRWGSGGAWALEWCLCFPSHPSLSPGHWNMVWQQQRRHLYGNALEGIKTTFIHTFIEKAYAPKPS